MIVLVEGHRYVANNFEKKESGQTIQFIHKLPIGDDGELATVSDGTTNEELLAVLIDRMNYLNDKFPCDENNAAIHHLNAALTMLENRTAKRVARNVEGKNIA